MATQINQNKLDEVLFQELNKQMIEAAEPVLKKALADIEVEMRKRMASMLIAYIQNNYSMQRVGLDLHIIIKQACNGDV